jgi:uncharacterized protein
MKLVSALTVALIFSAAPALAQIAPSTATPPKAPVQHTPTTPAAPAKSAQTPAASAKAPAAATADKIDPAKEAAIRHLMDITQTSKMGDNIDSYFAGRVRSIVSEALGPERTTKFMVTFSQKMTAAAPPSAILDAMVPIYAKAFSMEEIEGLVKFYDSPLGQRIVKVMPQVEEDSQNAALQIGNNATLTALQSMTDEYPELKQMLQAPSAGPDGAPAPDAGAPPAANPGSAPQK